MEAVIDEVRSFLRSELFTFLEDLLEGRKETKSGKMKKKKAIKDIKALVHKVGSFLEFVYDQVPESGILDHTLSDLLPKFELLNTKIKEHCVTVSKIPGDMMTPKTGVVSLFIVDSVLDDLRDLISNKSDKILCVHEQIVKLNEELMLLGSFITDIAEAEHEELVLRTRDIAYEVEYVVNSFPPVWYLTLRLPQLIEKIKLIRMPIQEINNKVDAAAGMPEVAKVSSQSIVVGFEKVQNEIVEQLARGREKLQIISIFGMPGLGKTTLAKKLYNHPTVCRHFDVCAWCVASQTYKKRNMLIQILKSIGHLKSETIMDDADLAQKLYQSLKGRRYLVVIDDIWDADTWNELERYFPCEDVGSRILFTTRHRQVGLKASASFMKELSFLSKDECWELLQRKVFQNDTCPKKLLEAGNKIASSCHGLPLAVVTVAGVLANMKKKEHLWQKVARNLTSYISENSDNFIQILELSYKHLPMHLKPCFLYFGAFREDEEIPVRKLTSLWIAEGYIKKEAHKCIEDVALKYLMELIDRSLVLVTSLRSNGQVKTCKIHDLLHGMCISIADDKNFLKVFKFNDDPVRFFSEHHCLVINYQENPINSAPFGPHVRSLRCFFLGSVPFISRSFKVVRVLGFPRRFGYRVIGIEHLVHLRYLAFNYKLPPMKSFHKLEFLQVDVVDEVEIPEILLNMVSLRQMYFRGGAYFSESCREKATKMNESFQIINSNLQSISALEIRDGTDEKILRCLCNLRRLTVRCGSSFNYSFDFINQLESLKLVKVGDSSFSLISLPLCLKQLTLADVRLSPQEMEIIGRLLNLEVLKLIGVVFKTRHWNTSEVEFPQLKFLKLCGVNLAEWNASSDDFPSLQQLVLRNCKHLKMIPSSFSDIPTLQMIQVYGCAKAVEESVEQILEEQQDMGNELLKVIISDLGSEEQEESGGEEQVESESEEEQEEKELLKRQTGKTQDVGCASISKFLVLFSLLLAGWVLHLQDMKTQAKL